MVNMCYYGEGARVIVRHPRVIKGVDTDPPGRLGVLSARRIGQDPGEERDRVAASDRTRRGRREGVDRLRRHGGPGASAVGRARRVRIHLRRAGGCRGRAGVGAAMYDREKYAS